MGTLTNSSAGKQSLQSKGWIVPGAAVVETLPFHCRAVRLHPWLGSEIAHGEQTKN